MKKLFRDINTNLVYEVPYDKLSIKRTKGLYNLKAKYKVIDDTYHNNNMRINLNNKSANILIARRSSNAVLKEYVQNLSTTSEYDEFRIMFRNLNYSMDITTVGEMRLFSDRRELVNFANIYPENRVCWNRFEGKNSKDTTNAINYFFSLMFNDDLASIITISGRQFNLVKRLITLKHGKDACDTILTHLNSYNNELRLSSINLIYLSHITGMYVDDLMFGRGE